jgi:hypothetical protein
MNFGKRSSVWMWPTAHIAKGALPSIKSEQYTGSHPTP